MKQATRDARDVVVIGAALGGLSALCKLLGALPRELNASILIALDLSSQPASSVLQILDTYAWMPVGYAVHGAPLLKGCIVLAPRDQHMRIVQPGEIVLEAHGQLSESGPSVDRLFETAALVYGKRVIGVILTGGSHAGTRGAIAIEAAGGICVVQDPDEAVDAEMPLGVLRGDHPDYCIELERMAPLLIRLVAGELPPAE